MVQNKQIFKLFVNNIEYKDNQLEKIEYKKWIQVKIDLSDKSLNNVQLKISQTKNNKINIFIRDLNSKYKFCQSNN